MGSVVGAVGRRPTGLLRVHRMHRPLASVEICLFIVAFPGWAYPYMLVTGTGRWRTGSVDPLVPWLWPMLWLLLLAARVARTVISRSKAPQTIVARPLPIAARAGALFAPSPFGLWLKRVREKHLGWNQFELALVCGVPVRLINGWETGWLPEPTREQRQSIFTDISPGCLAVTVPLEPATWAPP